MEEGPDHTSVPDQQSAEAYILLPIPNRISGQLEEFISRKEKLWRTIQIHEQYPYKQISKYFRNIEYKSENTRTVDCLRRSLKYIYAWHVPRIVDYFKNAQPQPSQKCKIVQERQHFSSFLKERLKAIRTEYFVQAIIYPEQLMKAVRLGIVLDVLAEVRISGAGLQHLIPNSQGDNGEWESSIKQPMQTRFKSFYIQALQYCLLLVSKQNLAGFLQLHPIIFSEQSLRQLLLLKRQLLLNNYYQYEKNLKGHPNPFVRCLLWSQIDNFRNIIATRLTKSRLRVKNNWLHTIMDWQKEDGWWEGGNAVEENQKRAQSKNKICTRLAIRDWVEIDELIEGLSGKCQNQQIHEITQSEFQKYVEVKNAWVFQNQIREKSSKNQNGDSELKRQPQSPLENEEIKMEVSVDLGETTSPSENEKRVHLI